MTVIVKEDDRSRPAHRLTYTATDETYVMTGTPVEVGRKGRQGACKKSLGSVLTLPASGRQHLDDRRQPRCPARPSRSRVRLELATEWRRCSTRDLTKSYGGRTVVRGVNLEIASGEVVGLLGPNGAGKTTTFSMVVGLTAPDSGRVLLDGTDVTDDPMYVRARKGIGYLPQEASIFRGLTVEQNILAILETLPLDGATRRARLRELLAELG